LGRKALFAAPLTGARIFAGGKDFEFLISDGEKLLLLKDSQILWEGNQADEVRDIKFDEINNQYWILDKEAISVLDPLKKEYGHVLTKSNLPVLKSRPGNCLQALMTISGNRNKLQKDLLEMLKQIAMARDKQLSVRFPGISGSDPPGEPLSYARTARFDYYASERWLPSDNVLDITEDRKTLFLFLLAGDWQRYFSGSDIT